jgi:hypothetical protein
MLCKKCGKPIEFIEMSNGKKMPVDAQMVYVREDPDGMVQVVKAIGRYGHQFNAVYANPGAPGTQKLHQTHWPNCAQGITRTAKLSQTEWRKRQDERRPARPTKSSTHHPHYDPHKKMEQKPKLEQIALF